MFFYLLLISSSKTTLIQKKLSRTEQASVKVPPEQTWKQNKISVIHSFLTQGYTVDKVDLNAKKTVSLK